MSADVMQLPNAAKKAANEMRAEWLYSIAAGYVTTTDVLTVASTTEGAPLRRLTLHQLLSHQPSWGDARSGRVITHLRRVLGESTIAQKRMTVAWLLDARAGGRRLQVFEDALAPRVIPFDGFPFTPAPEGGADD
ncbi:hypothetical protein [Rathayibacter rathayi]|uniref:hypothetical protein n=1 Tax=Rathayibacter rathayi TaxID=33887 RepID=UPI000CE8B538|nr:hypothetical protein [Rathayibacter rathayi]PPG14393.1 hypothetical protein C5C11_04980 [Rathayibacter rathayi]